MADMDKIIEGIKVCANGKPCTGDKFKDCPFSPRNNAEENCSMTMARNVMKLQKDYERLKERHKMLVNTCDNLLAELKKRTGRWLEPPECFEHERASSEDIIVCSVCKYVFNTMDNCTEEFDYCPHCGAKMMI